MNYQYKQQGGFILALALLMMLFIGVIVVSSIDRTGVEQRVATTVQSRPSLESATEAALLRVERRLAASDCNLTSLNASAACIQNAFSTDAGLADFLNLNEYGDGDGTLNSKYRFNQSPDVYYWIDENVVLIDQSTSPCTGSALGSSCKIRVVARSQSGSDLNNPILTLAAAVNLKISIPQFPPNSPVQDLFDLLDNHPQTIFLGSGQPPEKANPNQSNCIGGTGPNCQGGKNIDDLTPGDYAAFDDQDILDGIWAQLSSMEGYGFPVVRLQAPQGTTASFSLDNISSMTIIIVEGNGDVTFTGKAKDEDTNQNFPVLLMSQGTGTLTLNTEGQNSMSGLIFAPHSRVASVQGTPQLGLSVISNSLYLAQSTDLFGSNPNEDFPDKVESNTSIDGDLDFDYF
ncbi:MAG: hypothetical protein IBX50_03280 [Marinospirillum sp.]|uniref:hypothetical protein n=1 Tax=Marinospirillum sp. TaxID=2183934 RepID=UPI001A037EA0|nr:hypothetical protein [Marinospirillum sp.]MBE0505725.1 hypothetical protein [Marinospirillum sp.]